MKLNRSAGEASSSSVPNRRPSLDPDRALVWPKVKREFTDSGFVITGRPDPDGHPPNLIDDLTELSDKDLMVLMRQLLAWHEYAAFNLVQAEVAEEDEKANQRFAEAQAMVRNWGGGSGDRITIAKAERDMAPAVVDTQQKALTAYARRKLLQTVHDSLERKVALVSRELTRRTSMEPANRRAHRSGGA